VADAFDAMTTNRPYRKGLTVKTAVGELHKFSGKQFDPICVEAFLKAFERKLYKYFEKVEDSDDMILKEDELSEKDPMEGVHADKLEGQPYPPMAAHEIPEKKEDKGQKLESQPYPPVMAHEGEKVPEPSSQPYPPVGADDEEDGDK
jgi:hypothetical protein